MSMTFDEGEIDRVMELRKWIDVEDTVQWNRADGYQEFEVPIQCEEAYDLSLKGVLTEVTGYLKLNLFLGSFPIRMLHIGKRHRNPDGTRIGPRHKHLWTDEHAERWAYEPDDIDFTDTESAFWSFLEECSIEYQGAFVKPVTERRLL